MSSNDSTIEMIRAAQRGDKESWTLVYSQFYTGLYAMAVQRCRNVAMAEDAVQDTFIIAYLKLYQLDDPAAFPGWIKKILLNTCFKASTHHQKYQSLDTVLVESITRQTRTSDDQIDNELESKHDWLATQSALYSGLASLPESLRATLLLRYFFSSHSYQDIASILGIPIGTVRSRLNQAKVKFAEQWRSTGEDKNAISEVEYWNSFYLQTLGGIHHEDCCRDRFLGHFSKNAQFWRTGIHVPGDFMVFRDLIQDDRRAGSWIAPANVTTSGNLSIIESRHFNSPENPRHCPDVSLMIIQRHNEKASKVQLHIF